MSFRYDFDLRSNSYYLNVIYTLCDYHSLFSFANPVYLLPGPSFNVCLACTKLYYCGLIMLMRSNYYCLGYSNKRSNTLMRSVFGRSLKHHKGASERSALSIQKGRVCTDCWAYSWSARLPPSGSWTWAYLHCFMWDQENDPCDLNMLAYFMGVYHVIVEGLHSTWRSRNLL